MGNLSDADARLLTRSIVAQVRAMGGRVERFGVHLTREGFYFIACVNDRTVWCQTGQGNFTYRDVAAHLLDAALKAQTDPLVDHDRPASVRGAQAPALTH